MSKTAQQVSRRSEVRTRFAGLILQRLRADGVTRAQFDADSFLIRIFDNAGSIRTSIVLENAFAEYEQARGCEREEVIYRYVEMARTASSELPTTLRRASYNLLPRVAPRCLLEEMELAAHVRALELNLPAGSKNFSPVPYQSLGKSHCISMVYDFPTHVVTLQEKILCDWFTSFDSVLEVGRRNLAKISEEPFEELSEGLYVSPFSDNHDASRILLTDKIQSECKVRGEHVALLLNRDTLLIADSANCGALQAAAAIAATVMQEPRPYSAFPLVLRDSIWQDFELNEFHPAYNDFREMHLLATAHMYSRQKELLENLHESTGQEVFLATYVVLHDPRTEELFSFGTWTEGVDTLLPESEYIVFVQPNKPEGQQTSRCTFARAQEVVPHLLESTGLYPERFKVHAFPTRSELEKMTS